MKLTGIFSLLTAVAFVSASPMKRGGPGVYTIRANKPGHFIDGKEIQAANQHFWIGPGGPSAHCPPQMGQSCPPATDTVFGNGRLYVFVPGGQSTFVQKSGAFAFTRGHSRAMPDLYSDSTAAAEDLVFRGPWGVDWAACRVPAGSSSATPNTGENWQVYARIPDFHQTDCVDFQAKVTQWTGWLGAWQYV